MLESQELRVDARHLFTLWSMRLLSIALLCWGIMIGCNVLIWLVTYDSMGSWMSELTVTKEGRAFNSLPAASVALLMIGIGLGVCSRLLATWSCPIACRGCPRCGYIFQKQLENIRCPECGLDIDAYAQNMYSWSSWVLWLLRITAIGLVTWGGILVARQLVYWLILGADGLWSVEYLFESSYLSDGYFHYGAGFCIGGLLLGGFSRSLMQWITGFQPSS